MPDASHQKAFWDARAREDALYFVDNRLRYRDGDEQWFWEQGERDLDIVLASVGAQVEPTDRVLDVGCGVGRLTRVLSARADSVDAIDISAEMIERATANLADRENVRFHVGDGLGLAPIPDAVVDLVVSFVVFQHIPDPEVTLGYVREIGRVLCPGGRAVFQVSDDPSVHAREHAPPRLADRLLRRAPKGQTDPAWRGSAVDMGALGRVAREAGMSVERTAGEGTQFCYVRTRRT